MDGPISARIGQAKTALGEGLLGFDDLRHIIQAPMGIVAGIGIGRVADAVAGHIPRVARGGNCTGRIVLLFLRDIELLMQNLIQQRISGQRRSNRISELHHKLQQIAPDLIKPASSSRRRDALGAVFEKQPAPSRSTYLRMMSPSISACSTG